MGYTSSLFKIKSRKPTLFYRVANLFLISNSVVETGKWYLKPTLTINYVDRHNSLLSLFSIFIRDGSNRIFHIHNNFSNNLVHASVTPILLQVTTRTLGFACIRIFAIYKSCETTWNYFQIGWKIWKSVFYANGTSALHCFGRFRNHTNSFQHG